MSSHDAPAPREFWDQRYTTPGLLFGAEPNAFLRREAHRLAPGSTVLSVADGEGRNAIFLAGLGHRVTAFDISPVAMAKASEWATGVGVGVDFETASVDEWDWAEAAYDAVAAIFVQFADPEMRARLFANMWRSVKPGGLLLVQGYTPRQLEYGTGGPGKVENLYTPELLRGLLPQAEWLLLREHEDTLAEGTAHVGRSALIDAVARRPA